MSNKYKRGDEVSVITDNYLVKEGTVGIVKNANPLHVFFDGVGSVVIDEDHLIPSMKKPVEKSYIKYGCGDRVIMNTDKYPLVREGTVGILKETSVNPLVYFEGVGDLTVYQDDLILSGYKPTIWIGDPVYGWNDKDSFFEKTILLHIEVGGKISVPLCPPKLH